MLFPIIACSPYGGESRFDALSSKQCGNQKVLNYIISVFNVISDLYLLSIPIPVVWRLQMATRTKIGVSAVFMVGFLLVNPFFHHLNSFHSFSNLQI